MIETMKINFFIQLAEKDPAELEEGQADLLLEMARDGEIIRILKDRIIQIRAESEPA